MSERMRQRRRAATEALTMLCANGFAVVVRRVAQSYSVEVSTDPPTYYDRGTPEEALCDAATQVLDGQRFHPSAQRSAAA